MNRMEDVRPETFLQGVGQYSDVADQLGWLGATDDEVLMGLRGLGVVAQEQKSVMNSIIANARDMNAKTKMLEAARLKAAQSSPVLAVALAKKKAQTAMPGANETKGVREALNIAAKKAIEAKKEEEAARKLLAQSDKRGAAAKAVNALTKAREATIIANKAEKTRIARALDILANTLKAQADYIDSMIQLQTRHSGPNARTMALSAIAQNVREQIKRIKAQSATVASLPDVPSNAPDVQRIAELANKFNIRTAAESKYDRQRAVISVLSDLSENPMAQVKDYGGAYSYYGQDVAGKMMADMEFGQNAAALRGLAGQVHGIGYADTTPILASADRTIAQAQALAQRTYAGGVMTAAGLNGLSGGLGSLGDMAADHGWCDRNNSNAKKGGFPASELDKCKKCPNPVTPPFSKKNEFGYYEFFGKYECMAPGPESPVGRQSRGMTVDWAAVITGSGNANKPPDNTQPPAQLPATGGGGATGTSTSFMTGGAAPGKEDNTGLYIALGAGTLLAAGGVFWLMKSRKA